VTGYVIRATLVLAIGAGGLVGCSGVQDKAQVKLAAIAAGCEVEFGEAGSPGDLAAMQNGCTVALRLLDPVKPDGGAK
jgi:hypothetical protein